MQGQVRLVEDRRRKGLGCEGAVEDLRKREVEESVLIDTLGLVARE